MAEKTYEGALIAAGATVHDFREFGSYQGDWWALVTLPDGRSGWINGSYGSCSGCDAIQAEFDYGTDQCAEHQYEWDDKKTEGCEACAAAKKAADERFSAFGAGYLDGLFTQEAAEAKAAENLEWDSDAQEMLDYIKSSSVPAAQESK